MEDWIIASFHLDPQSDLCFHSHIIEKCMVNQPQILYMAFIYLYLCIIARESYRKTESCANDPFFPLFGLLHIYAVHGCYESMKVAMNFSDETR